jgi:hypothetical protein
MKLFNEYRGVSCIKCGSSGLHSRLFWFLYNYSGGDTLRSNKINCPAHEHLHPQIAEFDGKLKFVQLYPAIAADVQIEVGTTLIPAIWTLDDGMSEVIQFAVTVFSNIYAAIALVFLQLCGVQRLSKLFDDGYFSRYKTVLSPKILLPVYVSCCLIRYSLLGRGHTKEIGNCKAAVISENCFQNELST